MEIQTMTKKNIKPQQVAPVQRQVITISCQGEKALFASTECDISPDNVLPLPETTLNSNLIS
jgi:prenylated cyclic peptide (anacyclamide/piricyclamide family)